MVKIKSWIFKFCPQDINQFQRPLSNLDKILAVNILSIGWKYYLHFEGSWWSNQNILLPK